MNDLENLANGLEPWKEKIVKITAEIDGLEEEKSSLTKKTEKNKIQKQINKLIEEREDLLDQASNYSGTIDLNSKKEKEPNLDEKKTDEELETSPEPEKDKDDENDKEIKTSSEKLIAELEKQIEDTKNLIKGFDFLESEEKDVFENRLVRLNSNLEEVGQLITDREEKPFLYYALEKSANHILLNRMKDVKTGLLDLRNNEKDGINMEYKYLQRIADNEGFYNFNNLGFVMVIKNVDELITEDNKMSSESEKAIYKIVGPNGEIIEDDIVGYTKAREIYFQKSEEYEEKIKKEFEALNPGEENTEWLDLIKNKTEEEIADIKNECQGIKEARERIPTLEKIIGDIESRRAKELEIQPLKLKKNILNILAKWENYGQGEAGVKGFGKRMFKTTINIALIGGISSISIDYLARQGIATATALGAGVTSTVGKKMLFGLGLGSTIDLVSKKMSPKVKKWIPLAMGVGSVALATALSGAIAMGAAVGASAYLGYEVSKRFKNGNIDKKIGDEKEIAKQKLFEKYGLQNGTLDLNRIPKFEEEYRRLLIRFENETIKERLKKEAVKILVGSIVSGISMEASGFARDHFATHQPEITTVKEQEHADTNGPTEKEILNTKVEHGVDTKAQTENQHHLETKPENTEGHKEHAQTVNENKIETTHTSTEHKPISVEFSSKGGIQTILDMKAQIHEQYPDITKAPTEYQEFVHTNATQEAIKLGFYDPNNPNGAESMTVQHGSTLTFDGKGLSMHDIKTGEDHTLIETKGGAENIEKYHGKMFDSDHSASKIENTPHYNPNETPQQVDAETGQPINTSHYDSNNPDFNQVDQVDPSTGEMMNTQHYNPNEIIQQVDAETGKIIDTEHYNPNNQDSSGQIGHNTHVNNSLDHFNPERDLSAADLKQVHAVYEDNIKHLFQTDKSMAIWSHMKETYTPAENLIHLDKVGQLNPLLQPLANHIKNLVEITGFKPEPENTVLKLPAETIPHFITRALEAAKYLGKLDDVKL